MQPKEVKKLGAEGLLVTWQDGTQQQLSSRILRENCPCAFCKETRGESAHATPLSGVPSSPTKKPKSKLSVIKNELTEELSLKKIWPVGNYALGMEWGDKHNDGIYTWEYLRELSTPRRPLVSGLAT